MAKSITRTPVESSNLKSVGYDPKKRILEIEFKSGKVYQYSPVTQTAYQEFEASPSKGQWFIQNIRNNSTLTVEQTHS